MSFNRIEMYMNCSGMTPAAFIQIFRSVTIHSMNKFRIFLVKGDKLERFAQSWFDLIIEMEKVSDMEN